MRRWTLLGFIGVFFFVLWPVAVHADGQLTYQFERKWPLMLQQWYFNHPGDVAVSSSGDVYVADHGGCCIQKFDGNGNLLGKWGSYGSGDGQFNYPCGIAVDSLGNVYVADIANHRIQKFDGAGNFIMKWGTLGTGDAQFDDPSDVAVDSSDNVYVTDVDNHRILKFDSDGNFLTKWGSEGNGDGQFVWPWGIAVDTSGNVYVTDHNNNRIQKFDGDGVFLLEWGTGGTDDGELAWPRGIAVDSSGDVYVADTNHHRIQKFDGDGTFISKWGSSQGAGDGQFAAPYGVAVNSSGKVYVADYHNHRIQEFDGDGNLLAKWGGGGSGDGQFDRPPGIAVDGSGNVYVADTANQRIQKFDSDGNFLLKWGSFGTGDGQFQYPSDVAIDSSGNVYVPQLNSECIQKFDGDGNFILKWGSTGSGDGQFDNPESIAVDGLGNVYVAEKTNHRIQRFDGNGTFILKWGSQGSGDGQFNEPHGVAVDSSGNVYVAERWNNRIQKFDSSGNFLAKWDTSGDGDGEFNQPRGVAVDSSGYVYVADTGDTVTRRNSRIQKFDGDGNFLAEWCGYGAGNGQTLYPEDVAVDSWGNVYVADTRNNRVQKFKPVVLTERAKAIVVAGGGPYPGNDLWAATQGAANYAYASLTSQAFTKETIYYLSADTDLDLDNNGVADDVDGDCTKANLQDALLTWAPDPLGGLPTGDVVLYLVDHGGPDTFRVSGTEVLTAAELAPWLDTLEAQIQGKLIVVVDACYCGSFVDDISSPGRIVITSAASDEEAQFQGSVSFSDYFWTRVFAGDTVQDAFDVGVAGMGSQTPLLDDNGNGAANDGTDGTVAAVTHIGTGTQNTFSAPVITAAVGDHTLTGTATTTLWADATDTDGVASVWAVILPPDAESATSYPSEPLWSAGGVRWENTVDVFTTEGTYTVLLYARDRVGSTCAPTVVEVTVGSPLRRKALVVAGISDPASARWPGIEYAADQAYRALKGQSYGDDDIYYLSASGTVGVDATATWNNVHYAIETWAATDTHDLVVYLVGEGVPGGFVLNATEVVTSTELDGWLDTLQATLPGGVVVLADIDCAGALLLDLTPPVDKDRIVMATTGAAAPMHMLYGGAVSFSTYFWAKVLNGSKVGPAFAHAAVAMFYAAGASSSLDDTGDGLYSIKGSDPDGIYARAYRIGSGILLADDEPMIGGIVGEQTLNGTGTATIWVSNVTSTAGLDRVMATVRPPGMESVPGDQLPSFELMPVGGDQYEASYDGFTTWGTYDVSVVAIDESNAVSMPAATTVVRQDGPDAYEDDDAQVRQTWIGLNGTVQRHNIHDSGDEDWAVFYAEAGQDITVETLNLETNSDTYIELYRAGGALVAFHDDRPLDVSSYLRWVVDVSGYYSIRVTDAVGGYGLDTGYDLKAWEETGPPLPATLVLSVFGMGVAVPGATVTVTGIAPFMPAYQSLTGPLGTFLLPGLEAGTYSVTVSALGYLAGAPVLMVLTEGQMATTMVQLTPTASEGSVQVTLGPLGARAAGAQWRVDSGAWQASGATVTGLSAGAHTVFFNTVAGWDPPDDESVTVVTGQMTTASGSYTYDSQAGTGSLSVTLEPEAARTAGAQWRVGGSGWRDSGDTVTGLVEGQHTVFFSTVPGWNTPGDQPVSVTTGQTTSATGTYTLQVGSLAVTIEPEAARTAGAQWRVDGGDWQNSGATVTGLSVGAHTVSYNSVAGWNTPGNQTVSVTTGQTTSATGTYTLQVGSLTVTIEPEAARTAGAQWRVDGGDWQNSGAIMTGLSVGAHTVSYNSVAGWNTPSDESVTITNGQLT
ncbi:MAG: 6-bladed beta-propeller, partial [bacterium]|nr:6-bladed beta-propeller [bacterium]